MRYILVNIIQYYKGSRARDVDVIVAGSTPPTQGILCSRLAKKLSKKEKRRVYFVYNLQDVFPDSLVTTGLIKKNSLIWRVGRKIENYTYRNADKIIVISEAIKQNIIDKGVPENKIEVISNWVDTDIVKPVDKRENRLYKELDVSPDTFKIVYAGNFGKAQGLSVLLDAAVTLRDRKDIEFILFGRGTEEEQLKKRAEGMTNVRFFPLMPSDRISEVYSLADVCAVCCKKGTGETGLPSKTWTIMGCGVPLLVSFDKGEFHDMVIRNGLGMACDAEDADELANCICQLYSDTNKCLEMRKNVRRYVEENASKKICTRKHVSLLKNLID